MVIKEKEREKIEKLEINRIKLDVKKNRRSK
jgi:hypothetical protein